MPFFSSRNNSQPQNVPSYQHSSLPSDQHIRLFKITKSNPNQVSGSIQCFHISQCPTYIAISHVWNSSPTQHAISITELDRNRKPRQFQVLVDVDLNDALRDHMNQGQEQYIWIDTLCVDQKRKSEVDDQKRLMGEIFKRAALVVANLGSKYDTAQEVQLVRSAFYIMQQAVSFRDSDEYAQLARRGSSQQPSPVVAWFNSSAHLRSSTLDPAVLMQALRTFCTRHFWIRRWIIQELVLARDVVLRFNGGSMSLKFVERFFADLNNNPYSPKDAKTKAHHESWNTMLSTPGNMLVSPAVVIVRHRMSRRRQSATSDSLVELLSRYPTHQCAVPEDHIFALLGLLGRNATHLPINNQQSCAVKIAVTLRYMRDVEKIAAQDTYFWAKLLSKLLLPEHSTTTPERFLAEELKLLRLPVDVVMYQLGIAQYEQQTDFMLRLVPSVDTQRNIGQFDFSKSGSSSTWVCQLQRYPKHATTGRMNLSNFTLPNTKLMGWTGCRVETGDFVYQLPGTSMIIIARLMPDNVLRLRGLARVTTAERAAAGRVNEVSHPKAILQLANQNEHTVGRTRFQVSYEQLLYLASFDQ